MPNLLMQLLLLLLLRVLSLLLLILSLLLVLRRLRGIAKRHAKRRLPVRGHVEQLGACPRRWCRRGNLYRVVRYKFICMLQQTRRARREMAGGARWLSRCARFVGGWCLRNRPGVDKSIIPELFRRFFPAWLVPIMSCELTTSTSQPTRYGTQRNRHTKQSTYNSEAKKCVNQDRC